MAYTEIGRIRPKMRGPHSTTNVYEVMDLATNAEKTIVYMAIQNVPTGVAIDNTDQWVVFADVSENIGPRGIQGLPGVDVDNAYVDEESGHLKIVLSDETEFDAGYVIGAKGDKGDTGTIFTPSISEDGVVSWTNNGELENPEPVSVRGDDGVGISGIEKTAGNSAPGTTDTYTITFTDGNTFAFNVYNGENGIITDEEGNLVIQVDATLTQSGMAADAKVTGDAIAVIPKIEVSETEPETDIWIDPTDNEVVNIPQINDETVSDVDTWSSAKISQEIGNSGGGAGIDDAVTGTETTWSSEKIIAEINNAIAAIPNAEEASF